MLTLPEGEIIFLYNNGDYENKECVDLDSYEDFIEEIDYLLSLFREKPYKIIYLRNNKKVFEEII